MTEHEYLGPQGLRTRGTILVLPGRGETRRSYARFGARLAADAYRVRVLAPPASPDGLAAVVAGAVADLGPDPVLPIVLVGSDLSAAAVGALVAGGDTTGRGRPQAVVLAGLPGYARSTTASWDEELDARTHCPVHRGVLSGDADVEPGALDEAPPADLLDAAYGSTADLPHLLLIGDADPYADRAALTGLTKALPRARLVVVHDGHHDVLNDLQHRSVAAEIVTFLETVRNELRPVLSVESSAW
ncbi:alpha/beta hydrolase [Cryptosporangium sp. NPDC051539]|uniref:alpha/beta hydrolase n=1 Tax=Cryptosporangium sp. NPDC051539 TaxID=3363962 RepID=UPI0037921063